MRRESGEWFKVGRRGHGRNDFKDLDQAGKCSNHLDKSARQGSGAFLLPVQNVEMTEPTDGEAKWSGLP